jgi:hypothetical protein
LGAADATRAAGRDFVLCVVVACRGGMFFLSWRVLAPNCIALVVLSAVRV